MRQPGKIIDLEVYIGKEWMHWSTQDRDVLSITQTKRGSFLISLARGYVEIASTNYKILRDIIKEEKHECIV